MPAAILEELIEFIEQLGASLAKERSLLVSEKGPANLVTDLDVKLEEGLRGYLPGLWSGSVVVGEEGGGSPAEWTWWVDPLDGTTNRVHGWPRSAISVALYQDSCPQLGVVHDPYLKETFWAARGGGAWLGSQRLKVTKGVTLDQALVCTGFASEPLAQWELCRRLQAATRGLRVSGCASLDIAYVAAGRADVFLEVDLKPWDVAAGLLLLGEAGGEAVNYEGGTASLASGNYLAGSRLLLDVILAQIADCGL